MIPKDNYVKLFDLYAFILFYMRLFDLYAFIWFICVYLVHMRLFSLYAFILFVCVYFKICKTSRPEDGPMVRNGRIVRDISWSRVIGRLAILEISLEIGCTERRRRTREGATNSSVRKRRSARQDA